ncbi:MAG: sulfatase-like hydrolase/transferase, partial [Opitutales bacterium]|nr:sulfatase-like hydrolase/transferase [Opitutales bacterium]
MNNYIGYYKKALTVILFLSIFTSSILSASMPNILFIAVDDMNDWIGPLGGLDIAQTPGLDRLAAEGVTFANAHCASPACASSRLANMT